MLTEKKETMENIQKMISNKRDIATSTARTYAYSVLRLQRLIDSMDFENKLSDIKSKTKGLSASVRKMLVTAAIVFLKAKNKNTTKLSEFQKELNVLATDQTKLQKKTDKDAKQWITLKDVQSVLNQIKSEIKRKKIWENKKPNSKDRELLQLHFIIEFYTKFAIRNELATVIIATPYEYQHMSIANKKKGNWLVDNKIYNFVFKTAKHFDKRGKLPLEYKLNRPMMSALKKWLKVKPEGKHLFYMQNNTPLTGYNGRAMLGKWLAKTFYKYIRKRISTQMLRKVYLTSLLQDSLDLKSRLDTMEKMGQTSLFTQESYRRH